MTKYGYARVSTDGQSLDAQLAQLNNSCMVKIFWGVFSPVFVAKLIVA